MQGGDNDPKSSHSAQCKHSLRYISRQGHRGSFSNPGIRVMEKRLFDPALPRRRSRFLSLLTLGCVHKYHADVDSRTSVDSRRFKVVDEYALPVCGPTVDDPLSHSAYSLFLQQFPEYSSTSNLDDMRLREYNRLDESGETYVDYMGGSLYPESLVRWHTELLQRNIFGNTHSISPSAQQSSQYAHEARKTVLEFFGAPDGYTVIFTANASAALKLVGEAFPFSKSSCVVLGADSHNSVHGIRQFATKAGATVQYIPTTSQGGIDASDAQDVLLKNRPRGATASVFILTGQSNVTNSKAPLSLLSTASMIGYSTLLDAAALAPTSRISLAEYPVDAMAVSFYKMFGYPTGIGALIAKESFLTRLHRPWFAGGTVEFVQSPGTVHFSSMRSYECFEDGTINYLGLPAITEGLRFLSAYLPHLPTRLSALTRYLVTSLAEIRHDCSGAAVTSVLSRVPEPTIPAGEPGDAGSVVSLIFHSPTGEILPLAFIEHAASQQKISLRTGCMCNSGGTLAMRGLRDEMAALTADSTLDDFRRLVGREVGVVRISLGLASNFHDVRRVLQFVKMLAITTSREAMWAKWQASSTHGMHLS